MYNLIFPLKNTHVRPIRTRHSSYKYFYLFILLLFSYNCPNFSPPGALPCLVQPPLPKTFPTHCPCPWVLCACSLTWPFSFFPPVFSPLPSGHCQFVLYFHVSGSFLLIYFVLLIRFHLQVRLYGICLSLLDLLYLAQYSPVPSILSWRVQEFLLSFCCIVFHCVNVS